MADAKGFTPDPPIRSRDLRIGCVGAGMIMAECHLAAYREAGFPVAVSYTHLTLPTILRV